MSHHRRAKTLTRFLSLSLATLAALSAALLLWSLIRPSWFSRGQFTAGISRGQIEVAWANATITRDPSYWTLRSPQGFASILVGPGSGWRPSISRASLGMGASAATASLFRLTALYIPLWPCVALLGGGAALFWWRAGHIAIPGHCRKCGYNLEGLAADRCPECGTPQTGLITLLVRALRPVTPTRQRRRLSFITAR